MTDSYTYESSELSDWTSNTSQFTKTPPRHTPFSSTTKSWAANSEYSNLSMLVHWSPYTNTMPASLAEILSFQPSVLALSHCKATVTGARPLARTHARPERLVKLTARGVA